MNILLQTEKVESTSTSAVQVLTDAVISAFHPTSAVQVLTDTYCHIGISPKVIVFELTESKVTRVKPTTLPT